MSFSITLLKVNLIEFYFIRDRLNMIDDYSKLLLIIRNYRSLRWTIVWIFINIPAF